MIRFLAAVATVALISIGPGSAHAQGVADVRVVGSQVLATIALPEGLGADLTLTFEQAVGLQAANLGLSAAVADPLALVGRLPAEVSLPSGFPVVLHVEPPPAGGLSFAGMYTLELHTHNLEFQTASPLRLFTASGGGSFRDVTEMIGMGSYRVRGSGGSFSEFLIVADLRLAASVIDAKFADLAQLLADHADLLPAAVGAELDGLLAEADAAHRAGARLEAVAAVEAFAEAVRVASGSGVPDVWRAPRDLTNLAGLLRAGAATLRFSLNLAG